VADSTAIVESVVAPAAELERWTSRVRTRNGAELCIRPLRPDDREREIAFIQSLSERTRYFRLFTPLRFLPPHLLDQLMDVDYRKRMAFVATRLGDDGAEEFVGLARYGQTDEEDSAEIAVTVTDACQHSGIGRLLMLELIRFARERGLRRLVGDVLPENAAMLGLARGLGFKVRYDALTHLMAITRELEPA
jgi:RimJ/RimL family protein N-acetyltransferase